MYWLRSSGHTESQSPKSEHKKARKPRGQLLLSLCHGQTFRQSKCTFLWASCLALQWQEQPYLYSSQLLCQHRAEKHILASPSYTLLTGIFFPSTSEVETCRKGCNPAFVVDCLPERAASRCLGCKHTHRSGCCHWGGCYMPVFIK